MKEEKLVMYSGKHVSCRADGHFFQGRWDHCPEKAIKIGSTYGDQSKNILSLTRENYIHDVCIYCGMIVKPEKGKNRENNESKRR